MDQTVDGWSIVDKWTLTVAMLALIVAVIAGLIAWYQYRLGRDAAGGRGILFDLRRPLFRESVNGVQFLRTHVRVELYGPGERYEVAVHLERDGHQLEAGDPGFVEPLPTRKAMACTDEPIVWNFRHEAAVAEGLWCVLSWVEPHGEGIWTHAYARELNDPTDLYEWRWYRTRRFRRWLQNLNMRVRPLGRWQRNRELHLEDGHGPFDLRYAPNQAPRPRLVDD